MNRKCPVCKKAIEALSVVREGGSNCLPFCSERCKLVDLGAWFEGEYRITSPIGSGQDKGTFESA